MTMDKSLRMRAGMIRTRNVLTRDERIRRLQAADRWQEGDSPFGLAKVRVYKLAMKKKKKKKKEDEEGAEGEAVPPPRPLPPRPPPRRPPRPAAKARPRSNAAKVSISLIFPLVPRPPLRVESARHGRISHDRRLDPAGLPGFGAEALCRVGPLRRSRPPPTMAMAAAAVASPPESPNQAGHGGHRAWSNSCSASSARPRCWRSPGWAGRCWAGNVASAGWLPWDWPFIHLTSARRPIRRRRSGRRWRWPAWWRVAVSPRWQSSRAGRHSGRLPGRHASFCWSRCWCWRRRFAWRFSGGANGRTASSGRLRATGVGPAADSRRRGGGDPRLLVCGQLALGACGESSAGGPRGSSAWSGLRDFLLSGAAGSAREASRLERFATIACLVLALMGCCISWPRWRTLWPTLAIFAAVTLSDMWGLIPASSRLAIEPLVFLWAALAVVPPLARLFAGRASACIARASAPRTPWGGARAARPAL